ncbi:MAG: glutamyl-tRNA reductase [Aquificaceae bacterium]|nr:MAG: glutamyl-tRNA reductase [Aquificaceae bacterium]
MEWTITAIGVNHQTAPVEVRELFSCTPKEGRLEELSFLSNLKGVKELVLLSTCNRVEIYALTEGEEVAFELLEEFLKLKLGKVDENLKKHFFVKTGREAVEHILSIPCGLSSMVLGENQITSQFKEAFELARRHKTLGKVLERLYQRALKTAKRVRSETAVSKTPVSVSYIAVILAKNIFGLLEGCKVLVVGAGETAELTALYLKREKAQIFVTNRTFERAVSLAQKIGGSVIDWNRYKEFLKEVDIAIFSTASQRYLITAEELSKLFRKKSTPTVFIDISVPRNVDPKVANLEGVFLFNIDDLREIAEKNLQTRREEAKKGWLIVREETEKFLKWFESLERDRLIKELNSLVEKLKKCSLSEGETPKEVLDRFTKRFMYPLYRVLKGNPQLLERFVKELKEVTQKVEKR